MLSTSPYHHFCYLISTKNHLQFIFIVFNFYNHLLRVLHIEFDQYFILPKQISTLFNEFSCQVHQSIGHINLMYLMIIKYIYLLSAYTNLVHASVHKKERLVLSHFFIGTIVVLINNQTYLDCVFQCFAVQLVHH